MVLLTKFWQMSMHYLHFDSIIQRNESKIEMILQNEVTAGKRRCEVTGKELLCDMHAM